MDPYERADITSDQYYDWLVKNAYLTAYGAMKAAAFLETFVAVSAQPAAGELLGRPDHGERHEEDREGEAKTLTTGACV